MCNVYPYVTTSLNRCGWCGGSLKLVSYNDADTGKRFCSSYCFMKHATSDRPDNRQLELEFSPFDFDVVTRYGPPSTT